MPFDRDSALRRAEKLLRQGKVEAAAAEYRAVIDDQPADWNTANTLGDLYARIGQTDKAVAEYQRSADHLAREGFLPKASALYKKILKIRPEEEGALWQLGRISAAQGLLADARVTFLTLIDRRRARRDRRGEAEAIVQLGELDGADVDTRLAAARARAELGDAAGARDRLHAAAADLRERGREDDALRLLAEAAVLQPEAPPEDPAFEAADETASAAELWTRGEAELRAGRVDAAIAHLRLAVDLDGGRRGDLIGLACALAEGQPDAGYACIELAAAAAMAADDWSAAAEALQTFVAQTPGHIPALMNLVETCVDGGLETAMHEAQAQLADAYLAAGAGAEARVIAEDLVARAPWESAHLDRFRRALSLLGEQDADALIAERLDGAVPFVSTDHGWTPAPPAAAEVPIETEPPPAPADRASERPAPDRAGTELDLGDILHELQAELTATLAGEAPPLEAVLDAVREQAVQNVSPESAERHLTLAATYVEMGMAAEAREALQVAARSPQHRFRAAAALGKAWLEAGDPPRAIEWYERAADAPAPSPEAYHALLYDLALILEAHNEGARALAVLLELRAEAGDYRDVAARLEQLKVQMGH